MAELDQDFITALELHDLTLAGNDTGGGVCQFLVDAHPDRIGRTDLTEVAPRLHRFGKSVRLVWGTADRCFTTKLGRRLAALFPDATLVEVPGAKTFVPLDNSQAVVDGILAVNGVASRR